RDAADLDARGHGPGDVSGTGRSAQLTRRVAAGERTGVRSPCRPRAGPRAEDAEACRRYRLERSPPAPAHSPVAALRWSPGEWRGIRSKSSSVALLRVLCG